MQLFEVYKKQILFALVGGLLISGAILAVKLPQTESQPLEIISGSEQLASSSSEVFVEIAGAVNKPGVYKLNVNSRIEDLILIGGGLSTDADSDYVAKTINRAGIIKDGQKLYIPKLGQITNEQSQVLSANDNQVSTSIININTASKNQLESLWGIGPVTAQNIIDQRPYSDTGELLTRSIVKQNVYDRIKEQISIY